MSEIKKVAPISYPYAYQAPKGLSERLIIEISKRKNEPEWMLDKRIEAYQQFLRMKLPTWGPSLSEITFEDITYYASATDLTAKDWSQVPEDIKKTYSDLGIPEAERKYLSGVSAQLESEIIYEAIRKEITDQGVIFLDTSTALQQYPKLFEDYFGTLVPQTDNIFAALNTAVWSGGSFIYIPKNLKVSLPLQAFFLINAQKVGQFERTLIIADEGSFVHYIEGCTAPQYTTASLHAAVVEIFVKKNARVRYTTVQNWSNNVYNLTTKRSVVEENGVMEWVDANIGSRVTMKYPACILKGDHARGEVLSVAFAKNKQHQDTGARMIHLGKNTTSRIISKSLSQQGGHNSFRSQVVVSHKAKQAKSYVSCDALLLDEQSKTDTYPQFKIDQKEATIEHEATVEKISGEKLFYLSTRGINTEQAATLLVNGFIEPVVKEIPLEYAVEMNRLIQLDMKGSVG